MTITSSGIRCDICGKFILPMFHDTCQVFTIDGLNGGQMLHGHDECTDQLKACGTDWKKLPPGPIRSAFEKASRKFNPEASL